MRWFRAFVCAAVVASVLAVVQPGSGASADPGTYTGIVSQGNGSTTVVAPSPSNSDRVWQSTYPVTAGDLVLSVEGTSSSSYVVTVALHHSDTLVLGGQDALPFLGRPGTLQVDQLERDPSGALVALAVSWSLAPLRPAPFHSDQGPTSGLVRWHSSVPWSAVLPSSSVVTTFSEVGVRARTDLTLDNRGPVDLDHLSVSVVGDHAANWSVDPSSECLVTVPLAVGSQCNLSLVLASNAGGYSTPTVVATWGTWTQVLVPALDTFVVGRPDPPALSVSRTALGGSVFWPGYGEVQAEISRSVDGGLTWGESTTLPLDPLARSHAWTDPAGFASGDDVHYRVRVTDSSKFADQQGTYTSDWAQAAAPATGASLVVNTGPGGVGSALPQSSTVALLPRGLLGTSAWASSPDGSAMVTVGWRPQGNPVVARIDLRDGHAGPPVVLYAREGTPGSVSWSPDGRTLAWTEDGMLMTAPADGRGPVLVGPVVSALSGWMPDSQVVVVGRALYDTVSRQLLQAGVPGPLTVSPDGRRAVSVVQQPGGSAVVSEYAVDPNTVHLVPTGRSQSTTDLAVIGQHLPTVLGFAPDGASLLMRGSVGELAAVPLLAVGPLLGEPVTVGQGLDAYSAAWHSTSPQVQARTTGASTTGFTMSPGLMAPGTTLSCRLDTVAAVPCSTLWSVPTSLIGRHTLTVRGTEPGGRTALAVRTWQNGTGVLAPGTSGTMPGLYAPLAVARRVLDTRSGVGAPRARVGAGRSVTLTIPGVPADVTAVTLNLTAIGATAPTFVTVYPADSPRPGTSSLNVGGPAPIANLVTVRVAPGGRVVLYNSAGTLDLVADLQATFARSGSSRFTPAGPTRILDTRSGLGGVPGPVRSLDATSPLGVLYDEGPPYDKGFGQLTGVVLNATVTSASQPGYLALGDYDAGRPSTSNLSFATRQTVANLAMVPAKRGTGSSIGIWVGGGPTQVIGDLLGWFGLLGSAFTPAGPTRVVDTRSGLGAPRARVGAGGSVTITIPGLPSGTTAVAVNITAVGPTAAGYLTAYPAGQSRPGTSTVSFTAGRTVANATIVGVDGQGRITLTNATGSTDVVVDLQGWFAG